MFFFNGINSLLPPAQSFDHSKIDETIWQDLSDLFPPLNEDLEYSCLRDRDVKQIASDRHLSDSARKAGLLPSSQMDFYAFLNRASESGPVDLQNLFTQTWQISEKENFPGLNQGERQLFSKLIARLCDPVSSDRPFFPALLGICHLLCHIDKPLLTSEAVPLFIQALLLHPDLSKCRARDKLAVFECLEFLIAQKHLTAFTPEQTQALAAIIASFHIQPPEEGHLPILTVHMAIPGLIDALLTNESVPPHKRLVVSAYWSQTGDRLSDEARPFLSRCLEEIGSTMAPMEIEYENEQLRAVDRPESALGAFSFLMLNLSHLQLSDREVERIDALLRKMLALSPGPQELESTLHSLVRLYQIFPLEQLKKLEERFASLLLYAVDRVIVKEEMTHFFCVLRGSYSRNQGVSLLAKTASNSQIGKRVSDALKILLKKIPFSHHPLSLRISAVCALAGILSDFSPKGDCLETIQQVFGDLVGTIKLDFPEKRLANYAFFLFQQFPMDSCTPLEIANLIIGLSMLGCNSLFSGFRTGDWPRLQEMITTLVVQEGSYLKDEEIELLVWLSYMAEQGKLAPLEGNQKWLDGLLTKSSQNHGAISFIVACGKLAASNRFPKLSAAGTKSLNTLVGHTLDALSWRNLKQSCDVLKEIGWLYHKGILAKGWGKRFQWIYISLILKLTENYGCLTREQKHSLLFFITAISSDKVASTITCSDIKDRYVALIKLLQADCLSLSIQAEMGERLKFLNVLGKRKQAPS